MGPLSRPLIRSGQRSQTTTDSSPPADRPSKLRSRSNLFSLTERDFHDSIIAPFGPNLLLEVSNLPLVLASLVLFS